MSNLSQIVQIADSKFDDNVDSLLGNINFDLFEDPKQVKAISKYYNSRFVASLGMVLSNNPNISSYSKSYFNNVISQIDEIIEEQVNKIIKDETFRELESEWLQIQDVVNSRSEDTNVEISILDVSKEELLDDFSRNLVDIASSDLFKKIYVEEFDQYGGEPFGTILGTYDFENTDDDILWLLGMGKVAEASHSPFISNLNHNFFGVDNIDDLNQIKNFEALLEHPRYKNWNDFRKSDAAVYVGLTLGKYVLRQAYDPVNNPVQSPSMKFFSESVVSPLDKEEYLWGGSASLFAKNIIRSHEKTSWFQHIRGVENGGIVEDLISPRYNIKGYEESFPAVNINIPDYMELSLSKIGITPLVLHKQDNKACFFSCNSLRKVEEYIDPLDSINSQFAANMSYTLCVSKIAHYVKHIIRDKIGSVADATTIQGIIERWLSKFITTIYGPSQLEIARFPFRSASVEVEPIKGKAGWYHTSINIMPHIQFEGMSVTMKVDARLEPSLFGDVDPDED